MVFAKCQARRVVWPGNLCTTRRSACDLVNCQTFFAGCDGSSSTTGVTSRAPSWAGAAEAPWASKAISSPIENVADMFPPVSLTDAAVTQTGSTVFSSYFFGFFPLPARVDSGALVGSFDSGSIRPIAVSKWNQAMR